MLMSCPLIAVIMKLCDTHGSGPALESDAANVTQSVPCLKIAPEVLHNDKERIRVLRDDDESWWRETRRKTRSESATGALLKRA